jgi:hypothetical protein
MEEVKIRLPLFLTSQHHLLFSFYHVSYTHQKDDTVIGHSFLPIYKNNVIIVDKEYELPVTSNLIPHYMIESQQGHLKWLENKKALFRVNLKLSSWFLYHLF